MMGSSKFLNPYALIVGLLAGGWMGRADGAVTRSKARLDLEFLAGGNSNPLYLPTDASLHEASPVVGGALEGDWNLRFGTDWELRSDLSGSYLRFPNREQGNIGELWWSESVRLALDHPRGIKADRKSSHVGLSYDLKATDNAILSSSERSSSTANKLGYLRNRGALEGLWNTGPGGAYSGKLILGYRNYRDLSTLLAPLDQLEEEIELQWESPGAAVVGLEAGQSLAFRQYLHYPSRNRQGDTVSRTPKRYRTWSSRISPILRFGKAAEAKAGYEYSVRKDTYQGYFDCSGHDGSLALAWKPLKSLKMRIRASRKYEIYDFYRVGYNPTKPLKRIRYDLLEYRAQYNLELFHFFGRLSYRAEKNNSPGYSYGTVEAMSGVGIGF